MKLLATLLATAAFAVPAAAPADRAVTFLEAHRQADGGFAEKGRRSDPALTSWAVLGLVAAGHAPPGAADYLSAKPVADVTDLALRALALRALGRAAEDELDRLEQRRLASGRIGPLVNSTIWGVLALRSARRPVAAATIDYLRRQQRRSGGWSWAPHVAPDSNDTAAAIQALRAVGVTARDRAIRRGFAFLGRLHRRAGGFALAAGRAADAQSTAWALQAYLSAGRAPPRGSRAFLLRLSRSDGSFRYSAKYAVTPVWVTSQVLPALVGKAFPLN